MLTFVESSWMRVCLAMKRTPAQARWTWRSWTQLRLEQGIVVLGMSGDGNGNVSSGSQLSVEPSWLGYPPWRRHPALPSPIRLDRWNEEKEKNIRKDENIWRSTIHSVHIINKSNQSHGKKPIKIAPNYFCWHSEMVITTTFHFLYSLNPSDALFSCFNHSLLHTKTLEN